MKLSNYVPNTKKYTNGIFATVDKTTGFLWWKKTRTISIYKANYKSNWIDVVSNKVVPFCKIYPLVDDYLRNNK